MSGVLLESFASKLQGKPYPLREQIASYQEYWLSMKEPVRPSPKDGSKIEWRVIVGQGKGTVHLGVSGPGHDFWRYEYGSGRGIEPARPTEARELETLLKEQAERDRRDGQTDVESGRRQ